MSGIRKMFDLAGPDSINLGLGEPDLDPPKEAIEGMNAAALAGLNKYGPTAGIMDLRNAVAEYCSKFSPIDGNNVMITPSGSTALLEITQSMVDPGDEVLVPSPGFVIYGPHAELAGGKSVEYRLTDDGTFQPDIDDIQSKITPKTTMIVVNTPSNPTGGVLTEENKRALCDIARDRNITILADEVYNEFIYEGEPVSFLDSLDCAVVASGFSKMMAVTGWRMGYLCADLDNARRVFRSRRDLITRRINEIPGMHLDAPHGAFYAFPSFDLDMSSADLANELARNGLICTPGSAFGSYGEGHLRFSYAADESKIDAGMDILSKVITERR